MKDFARHLCPRGRCSGRLPPKKLPQLVPVHSCTYSVPVHTSCGYGQYIRDSYTISEPSMFLPSSPRLLRQVQPPGPEESEKSQQSESQASKKRPLRASHAEGLVSHPAAPANMRRIASLAALGEEAKLQACLCRIHPLKEGSDLLSLAAQLALAQDTDAPCHQWSAAGTSAGSSSQVRKGSGCVRRQCSRTLLYSLAIGQLDSWSKRSLRKSFRKAQLLHAPLEKESICSGYWKKDFTWRR